MSSIARRTLRTSLTAAGVAAMGVALVAPAFAAVPGVDALPALPGADALPALPGADALPALPGADALPPAFAFEMPNVETQEAPDDASVNTALPGVPSVPALPGTDALPPLPSAGDLPLPALPGPEVLAPVVNTEASVLPDVTAISPSDAINKNAVIPAPPAVDPSQVAALATGDPGQIQNFQVG